MASVVSGGTTDRIVARILFRMVRAGSGTAAMYSSTFFGTTLPCRIARIPPRLPILCQTIYETSTQMFEVKRADLAIGKARRRFGRDGELTIGDARRGMSVWPSSIAIG